MELFHLQLHHHHHNHRLHHPPAPLILPMALMVSSSSSPCSLPVSGADFFLNLKLLNGDFDRVIDLPRFFSDAVLERRDIIAD